MDTATAYEISYQIDATRFSEVIASVTGQSVALLGFAPDNGSSDIGRMRVIGIFELEEPVDTQRTFAAIADDQVLVTLPKSATRTAVQDDW